MLSAINSLTYFTNNASIIVHARADTIRVKNISGGNYHGKELFKRVKLQ